MIGGGLLAVGFIFVILLACAASAFFMVSRNRTAAAELAAAKARMEQEAAQQRAEQEKRDIERNQAEAEQARRRLEQEIADIANSQAEAKRRREQEEADRRARDEEQLKNLAAQQQARKDLEAELAKAKKQPENKPAIIGAPVIDFQVNGVLAPGQFDRYRAGSYCIIHPCPMKAGQTYVIGLFSPWDNYLHLENPGGVRLVSDDDGGGGLNARIVFTCPADGSYRIIVTSFAARVTGGYTLKVHH